MMNYKSSGEGKVKNRFQLIVAFMITLLVVTSGSYAYTFTTASETIGIAEPMGDMATWSATATQPDWESVLIPEVDTEIFRPNAAGDETLILVQEPISGEHWDKVAEETPDGDSTYVGTDSNAWQEDLYNITNHSTQTAAGPINYVEVYMVCRVTANATQTNAYIHIKTNGVEYNVAEATLTTSWDTYSYLWDKNPQTGQAWTWDEIDALQIGVGLRRPDVDESALCTQVYAEVEFEAPPLTGNVPTDGLFVVYPHPDYSGDMAVKVYLGNTGNLTKAYQYLNMELYLEGSVEAGQTPNYRLLTLDNGAAIFKLENGSSDNYTLSVTGGDYCLTSREPMEWEAGWTVTPELYCEVTQR
ncbi:MAG: hypothetical protein ACETVS_02655 [Dehalococcoidales bacterium]